jgi:hypothetical protein
MFRKILVLFLCCSGLVFGEEIPNTLEAVKAASEGDYILIPTADGGTHRYVLSQMEIDLVNGSFSLAALESIPPEIDEKGTKIRKVSEGYTVYTYSDGVAYHVLKTSIVFEAFKRFIESLYNTSQYVYNDADLTHVDYVPSPSDSDVFRGRVEFHKIVNGSHILDAAEGEVKNYDNSGLDYTAHYVVKPNDFVWGPGVNRAYPNSRSYSRTGPSHAVEFE